MRSGRVKAAWIFTATGVIGVIIINLAFNVFIATPVPKWNRHFLWSFLFFAVLATFGVIARARIKHVPAVVSVCLFTGLFTGVILLATRWARWETVASFWTLPDGIRVAGIFASGLAFGVGFAVPSRRLHPSSLPLLVAGVSMPFLVLLLYYGHFPKILLLAWCLLATWGLGARLITTILKTKVGGATLPQLLGTPITLATGLATWQVIGVALGAFSLLTPALVFLAALISWLFGWPWLKRLPHQIVASSATPATPLTVLTAAPTLAFLLAGFIPALAPEVGSDALGGRVAMPVRFLAQQSLRPFEDILWSYGQIGGEVIFVFFLPWLGNQVAKLVNVGIAIALFLSGQRSVGSPFFASFFVSTLLVFQFVSGHMEVLQLLFWYAACQAGFLAWQGQVPWILVGFLLGAGAAVKLNALGLGVLLALALLWRRPFLSAFNSLARLGVGVLVSLGPFLLRSLWLTGNPIFPWLNALFKSTLVEHVPVAHFGVGLAIPKIFFLPWLVIRSPERFVEVGSWHVLTITSLLFLFLALGAKRTESLWYTYMAGGSWVLWLLSEQNLRYSFAPALFTVVAASFLLHDALPDRGSRKISSVPGLLAVFFVIGLPLELVRPQFWLGRGTSSSLLPTNFFSRTEDGRSYLRARLASFAAAEYLDARGLSGARVCQTGFRDHLYFFGTQPTDWHSVAPLSHLIAKARFSTDLNDVRSALRKLNCSVLGLAFGEKALTPWEERRGILSREFLESEWQILFAHNGLLLLAPPKALAPASKLKPHQLVPEWRGEKGEKLPLNAELPLNSQPRFYFVTRVPRGALLRIDLSSLEPSVGHVDFAFRDRRGRLVGFNRHAFRFTEGGQSWSAWQSAPPDADELAVTLVGQKGLITYPRVNVQITGNENFPF